MAENSRLQGCHKKHKALNHEEHEVHKGKEKLFFVLFVFFVVRFFSEPFATPSFAGVTMIHSATASLKCLPGIGYCQVNLLRRCAAKVVSATHRTFKG